MINIPPSATQRKFKFVRDLLVTYENAEASEGIFMMSTLLLVFNTVPFCKFESVSTVSYLSPYVTLCLPWEPSLWQLMLLPCFIGYKWSPPFKMISVQQDIYRHSSRGSCSSHFSADQVFTASAFQADRELLGRSEIREKCSALDDGSVSEAPVNSFKTRLLPPARFCVVRILCYILVLNFWGVLVSHDDSCYSELLPFSKRSHTYKPAAFRYFSTTKKGEASWEAFCHA